MNFWSFLKPSYCVQKCSQIICRPKPNLEAHTAARSEGVKESKISRVDLLPGLAGGRAGRQCGTCLADRDDDSEKSFQPASCCIGQVSTDEIWEVSAGVGWGGVGWDGEVGVWEIGWRGLPESRENTGCRRWRQHLEKDEQVSVMLLGRQRPAEQFHTANRLTQFKYTLYIYTENRV